MTGRDTVFTYSPPLLTEDGVFDVASDGRKFITKRKGILYLIDPISLAVIDEFSTYPEAKSVKFSPNSDYLSFIDKISTIVRVIHLDSKKVWSVDTDPVFSIELIIWSENSDYLVFFSELDIYFGIYLIGKDKLIFEGCCKDEFNYPLCSFNPNTDYFSVIRYDSLFSYSTETWENHSVVKCPIHPVGFIYTDVYSVAVWTSGGKFVVLSLLGKKKFEKTFTFSSRIKSVILCRERRVVAISIYDDKVELFDSLSWEKLYSLEYPMELNSTNSVIWGEVIVNVNHTEEMFIVDRKFEKKSSLSIQPVKNICDEFKLKTIHKFMLSFSAGNRLLASYSPGFPHIVWIRNLKSGKFCGVISMREGRVQGLKWHPQKEILAVTTLDSVMFWTEFETSVIYSKYLLSSVHWINTKLTICGISSEKESILVFLREKK